MSLSESGRVVGGVHERWLAAQVALSERLAATTFAELAEQDLELSQSR